jgi:outer membrane protein assembly factor BamB
MKNFLSILTFIVTTVILSVSSTAQENKTDLYSYKQIKWQYKTNGPIHGSPIVTGNDIIFGSGDQYIYSMNKNTGKVNWRYKTQGAIYSTPVISENIIYCTSMDGNLYALKKQDGTLKWKFSSIKDKQKDIWDYHNCSPSISDGMVYFGNGDGTFFALDKKEGKVIWKYKTNGIIHATPIVNEEKIFFGNFDGYFYALNKDSGEELWKFNTVGQRWFPKGAVQQGAAIYNDILYFGSRDFNIYALNAQTGTGMWNMYEKGSWVIATPTVKDTLILFGTSDTHHFYAMDARYGRVKWKKKLNLNVFGQCETGKELAYFGALNGKLYAVNLENGKTAWEFQTEESKQKWDEVFDKNNELSKAFFEKNNNNGIKIYEEIHKLGSIVSKPLLDNGILYFTSMNGKIYAIE